MRAHDQRSLTGVVRPVGDPDSVVDELVARVAGFGPLQRYLDDPRFGQWLWQMPNRQRDETDNRMARLLVSLVWDTLRGGAGGDYLDDNKGADVLYGGTGRDLLYSFEGRNRLNAGPGNDRLEAVDDRQRDVLNCGKGYDRVYYRGDQGAEPAVDMGDRLIGCEVVLLN